MSLVDAGDLVVRLIAVAHGIAATAVTGHALLHKRDVRATIGWIGIAWLSPVFGCVLYWLFGINRVARRAARLSRCVPRRRGADANDGGAMDRPVPTHLAAIAAVGDRTTRWPLSDGNVVRLLRAGDEAYPSMLEAIRNARQSLALASYIFRGDSIGCTFIDALAAANARGVAVRVLIDGIGGGYFTSAASRLLRHKSVPVARFLHSSLPWRMPLLNLRNHRKFLIVDGAIGFTGGLNIGAENVGNTRRIPRVIDVHCRVEGPVVSQLMAVFGQDWEFTTGEVLADDRWHPTVSPVGSVVARGISEGPDDDSNKLEMTLLAALAAARARIRIVTPYFLPDQRLLFALALASFRGIDVQILIPERSDSWLLDRAARAQLRELLDAGCGVFLSGAPFDHTKLMTVDGGWSFVGSANWDERSLRLNFEFNLEVYDTAVTADADRLIDAKIVRARRLSRQELDARPLPARLRDAAARMMLPYL